MKIVIGLIVLAIVVLCVGFVVVGLAPKSAARDGVGGAASARGGKNYAMEHDDER